VQDPLPSQPSVDLFAQNNCLILAETAHQLSQLAAQLREDL